MSETKLSVRMKASRPVVGGPSLSQIKLHYTPLVDLVAELEARLEAAEAEIARLRAAQKDGGGK